MNPPSEVPPCSEQRSETTCAEMFRDFPNSLENSQICRKVKEEGKKVDWILKHLAECDRSSDFFARFMSSHSHSPASPTPPTKVHVNLPFWLMSSCCSFSGSCQAVVVSFGASLLPPRRENGDRKKALSNVKETPL